MTLTVMCGLPESGKTTKANALAEATGATVICHDSYYRMAIPTDRAVTRTDLNRVFDFVYAAIREELLAGHDVIYDAVNYSAAHRARCIAECGVEGCRYVCMYMNTPEQICFERDRRTWSAVFAPTMEPPTEDEPFDEIIVCHDGYAAED